MSTKTVTPHPGQTAQPSKSATATSAPAPAPAPVPAPVPATTPARRGRKPIPKDETPEAAFKRLCEKRVSACLVRIRQIGNLARFKPTEIQHAKVFEALAGAMLTAEQAWTHANEETKKVGFTL